MGMQYTSCSSSIVVLHSPDICIPYHPVRWNLAVIYSLHPADHFTVTWSLFSYFYRHWNVFHSLLMIGFARKHPLSKNLLASLFGGIAKACRNPVTAWSQIVCFDISRLYGYCMTYKVFFYFINGLQDKEV